MIETSSTLSRTCRKVRWVPVRRSSAVSSSVMVPHLASSSGVEVNDLARRPESSVVPDTGEVRPSVLLLLAVLLAGCSSDSDDPAAAPTPAADVVTVEYAPGLT